MSGADETPVVVIEPRVGWRLIDWRACWRSRELLWVLAARDIQVRYKQTVLGVAWAVVQPLLRVLVFTLVFVHLMGSSSDGVPGAVFMFTGQIPWLLFSTATTAMGTSLVGSSNLVTKVYFPRILVPLSAFGAPLVDALIGCAVLLVLMLALGVIPAVGALVFVPLAFLALGLCVAGLGSMLAAFTVHYRDFRHVTPFVLNLWMFLTPVVWPLDRVPAAWQDLVRLNPLTGVVTTFRQALLGRPIDLPALGISFAFGVASVVVAAFVFARFERRFADVI